MFGDAKEAASRLRAFGYGGCARSMLRHVHRYYRAPAVIEANNQQEDHLTSIRHSKTFWGLAFYCIAAPFLRRPTGGEE